MDGALFCVFPPQGNKKRLEEIPNRNEIPLDRGKNHGKIRRLYDGRGYSAIFYR